MIILFYFLGLVLYYIFLMPLFIFELIIFFISFKKRMYILILNILILLFSVSAPYYIGKQIPPLAPIKMYSFFEKVSQRKEIYELQSWLNNLSLTESSDDIFLERSRWPKAIKKLSPNNLIIDINKNEIVKAKLIYGYVYHKWGIIVLNTNDTLKVEDGLFYAKLDNGLYVFSQMR